MSNYDYNHLQHFPRKASEIFFTSLKSKIALKLRLESLKFIQLDSPENTEL